MKSPQKSQDLFSRFVNWLSSTGADKAPTSKEGGGQDFFSKLMNQISN